MKNKKFDELVHFNKIILIIAASKVAAKNKFKQII